MGGRLRHALLFEAGKLLIGLYIGKSGVTQAFAAAGSLVVLLAWVYYAAQVFLLGAEFTRVYAQDRRGGVSSPPPGRRAAHRWRRRSPAPWGRPHAR